MQEKPSYNASWPSSPQWRERGRSYLSGVYPRTEPQHFIFNTRSRRFLPFSLVWMVRYGEMAQMSVALSQAVGEVATLTHFRGFGTKFGEI